MEDLIDIYDENQLRNWARRLGITPDQLARLVNQLGPAPQRIRDALKHEELARSGGRKPER